MNRHLSLLGLLALVACAATASPREHVADAPQFFHINPVRPVADLLPLALAATPPVEPGEFRPADLVELTTLDPTIKLDIRYATRRNFLGARHKPSCASSVRSQRRVTACWCTIRIGRGM